MTVDANTFALTPARRPTLNDFNGAAKANDAKHPPNAATQPTAEEYNTICKLVVAMGAVCPSLVVSISNDGATAAVLSFSTPGDIELADLSVTRVSAGLVKLTIDEDLLPPISRQPIACANGSTAAKCAARYQTSAGNLEFFVVCDIDTNVTISIG